MELGRLGGLHAAEAMLSPGGYVGSCRIRDRERSKGVWAMNEQETRDALVSFAAAALEVALDTVGDDDAPARDFGLDVRAFQAEDNSAGRAIRSRFRTAALLVRATIEPA